MRRWPACDHDVSHFAAPRHLLARFQVNAGNRLVVQTITASSFRQPGFRRGLRVGPLLCAPVLRPVYPYRGCEAAGLGANAHLGRNQILALLSDGISPIERLDEELIFVALE